MEGTVNAAKHCCDNMFGKLPGHISATSCCYLAVAANLQRQLHRWGHKYVPLFSNARPVIIHFCGRLLFNVFALGENRTKTIKKLNKEGL